MCKGESSGKGFFLKLFAYISILLFYLNKITLQDLIIKKATSGDYGS